MKNRNAFIWSVIFLIGSVACKQNPKPSNEIAFFDLKKYFITEADLHNALHNKAQKTLLKENHTEAKIFNVMNWTDELTPFIEADINKPAWKNSFAVDSIINGNKVQVSYSCKEKSVLIKKIIIEKTDQQITKINIETEKENIFYSAKSSLEYIPMQGYTIKNRQKSFLSSPDEFELKVIFTK